MTTQPLRMSVLDLDYVKVRVYAKENGLAIDPTADTVTMAFKASGDPAGGDFKAATWETDATTTPPSYYARCLVGPGGTVTLAAGSYRVWTKIVDAPEIPVKRAAQPLIVE